MNDALRQRGLFARECAAPLNSGEQGRHLKELVS
jgi:hypothetical protein